MIQRIDRLVWVYKALHEKGAVNDVTAQLSAGNDLLMPGLPSQKQAILEHMKSGKLSAAVVNTDLTRILELVLNHHQ
jgi:beta-glucosidase